MRPCTVPLGKWLTNSNTGEKLQEQFSSSEEELAIAMATAEKCDAEGLWENVSASDRADKLDQIADILAPRVEHMAWCDSVTTGVTLALTTKMCGFVPHAFRMAAKYIREGGLDYTTPGPKGDVEVLRKPWGIAVLISPWNGPSAIGSHKLSCALASGSPTIMKPSIWAPHSSIMMAEAIHEVGLPLGAFQLVVGSRVLGNTLVHHDSVAAISFTGGTVGGRVIAKACSMAFKPMQLELGGNNAFVVFADADLDKASSGVVTAMTTNNGQWCRALGRLLVHESVKEELIQAVLVKFKALKLGDSTDIATEMGPLVHEWHFESVKKQVAELVAKGGNTLSATPLPAAECYQGGFFHPPTLVVGCDPADTLEEVFGPVAMVHTFSDDAEALKLANAPDYGLAGYVFGGDVDHAWAFSRKLRTGGVKINGVSLVSLTQKAPRGAWKLSGCGEEGLAYTIQFFCGPRVIGEAA